MKKKIAFLLILTLGLSQLLIAQGLGIPRTMATLPGWAQPKYIEAIRFVENWSVVPDMKIWGNLRRIATFDIYITPGVGRIGWVYLADITGSTDYDFIFIFYYNGWHYTMSAISRR